MIVGVRAAAGASRVIRSLFIGVHAVDPQSIAFVAGVLTLGMLVATFLPARRVARLNPLNALRAD